jgi:hypothetical protein
MSSEAASPATPESIAADPRADRIVAAADGLWLRGARAGWDLLGFVRFLLFLGYLAISVVGFWLGFVAALLGFARLLVRLSKATLLYLSGGHPPPVGGPRDSIGSAAREELDRLWDSRMLLYADVTRPLARHFVAIRFSVRRFWHWTLMRKLSTVLVSAVLVGLPLAFIIPRPHEVQITDDNALSHADGELRYLVHALELDDPTRHREYENEYAPYLGKFNPQGLKSQLQVGKCYRLWIVGIRWYYFPKTMFPNIIWAQEIDSRSRVNTGPTLMNSAPMSATPAPAAQP